MKGRTIIAAMVMALLLLGCASRAGTIGSPIRSERVGSLIPGKTAKSDMLEMFGFPMAIAFRNDTLTLTGISYYPPYGFFLYRLRADTFFALFPPVDEYRRVYHYYYSDPIVTERLWVLVSEKTGIVEDYAYKEYEKDTVFGRTP